MRINKQLVAAALGQAQLSMEEEIVEAKEAQTLLELEHTFYARLVDFDVLKSAAKVQRQEQWQIPATSTDDMRFGGSVRVRAIDDETYVMCIKNFEKGKLGCLEHEFEVNVKAFEQIKRMSSKGMVKTRYSFPIEGTSYSWELDVFYGKDGNPHEWVKIDLEVDDPSYQIPEIPFKVEGLIKDNPANRTEEQQKLIDELMKSYMTTPNQYPAQ